MEQLSNEVEQFLRSLNDADQEGGADQDDMETVDVYFIPRQKIAPESDIVDATPAPAPAQPADGPSVVFTVATVFFYVGILFSAIALQLYLAFNPPVANVTIIPKTQTVTLTGTLQLGRLLPRVKLYQAQTVPTTGKGHQDATRAAGELVVYNGQSTEQEIPSGALFTGTDGVQVATDVTITVPASNPPTFGQATVSAHAVNPGARGNIEPGDINATVAIAVIAKNPASFSGGQDARDFQTVAKADIANAAAPLKTTLASAMQGALQGELKQGEELLSLPCSPTVESNHQIGDKATKVQVTVALTCNGVGYDSQQLKTKAAQLLTYQAERNLGAGYSLLGDIQVTDIRAIFPHTTPVLAFSSRGTWAYGLSVASQEHLKHLIAGRTTQEALRILSSLPGIQSVSIHWDQSTKLPKDARLIHYIFVTPTT
jgi:hypothetical protein